MDISAQINELLKKTGVTVRELADRTGCSYNLLCKSLRGASGLSMNTIVRIADFFAVPLDFLCGRCTEEQARQILDNYAEHFQELRRAAYEDYLIKARQPIKLPDGKNGYPYPYNLLHDVSGKPVDFIVSDDRPLLEMLSSLSDAERRAIEAYYKDYKPCTSEEKPVIRRALRKMRKKAWADMLRLNISPSRIEELQAEIADEREQLNKRKVQLDEKECKLSCQIEHIKGLLTSLGLHEFVDKLEIKVPDKKIVDHRNHRTADISALNLSVRTENCMRRANLHTIGQLIDFGVERLERCGGVGVKGYMELTEKLRYYRQKYGV